jgi:hypothetical protein
LRIAHLKLEISDGKATRRPRERRRQDAGGTKSLASEEVSYIESARLGHRLKAEKTVEILLDLLAESNNLRKENFKFEIYNFRLKGQEKQRTEKSDPKTSSFRRYREEWANRQLAHAEWKRNACAGEAAQAESLRAVL